MIEKLVTGRNTSFLKVLEILQSTYGETPINIIETGCIRGTSEVSKMGDGWSTFNWEFYAKQTGSTVYVVYINAEHIKRSQEIVPESEFVKYTLSDSVEYLQNFDKKIDLLFLDSFDYCGDEENVRACHNHSLNETLAAWDKLNDHCFILIDDVFNTAWDGKGKLTIPYLLENGFSLEYFTDQQALLRR
jgi:hypothetical protein